MKKSVILIVSLFLLIQLPLLSQQHEIVFQQCYGGTSGERAVGVHKTEDGYVVFGLNSSLEMPGNPEYGVFWLFKVDDTGEFIWEHAYGGSGWDEPMQLLPTNDKGYLLFGDTASDDGDVICNHDHGGFNVWIVKTDSMGQMEWQRCYGGSHYDWAGNIITTTDGGYIFSASAVSTDGDVGGGNPGVFDAWLVKINATGEIEWSQVFGGVNREMGGDIIHTSDGGYLFSVNSRSPEICPDMPYEGNSNFWLIKLSALGEIEWQQCYGGSNNDGSGSLVQTADGGYAFATPTWSSDGDVSGCVVIPPGLPEVSNLWFVKIDAYGNIEWQECIGSYGNDGGRIFSLSEEGNFLIGGSTTSSSGDVVCNYSFHNIRMIWIMELSPTGEILWQECRGSSDSFDRFADLHRYSTTNIAFVATVRLSDLDVDCTMPPSQQIWLVDMENKGVGLPGNAYSEEDIAIHPNPASTQAWLQLPENLPLPPMQIELYSPTGRLLYKAQPQDYFHKIEVAHLPKGLYLVRVWDGESWVTTKLLLL